MATKRNMKKLLFSNLVLNNRDDLSDEYSLWNSIKKTINASTSIIDRTETVKCPINYKVLEESKIPTSQYNGDTYENIVSKRCEQLINLNTPIKILWSGGIDSTLVVATFLKNYNKDLLKSRITILMSRDSIVENPYFYKHFIAPTFNISNSEKLPHFLYDNDGIIVTGELNDQLSGKVNIRDWAIFMGNTLDDSLSKNLIVEYYVKKGLTVKEADYWYNNITSSASSLGIEITNINDFFWWFNFCFFWQDTSLRIYCLTLPFYANKFTQGTRSCVHFYNTPEFQLWALNNPSFRKFSTWNTYKQHSKDLIFKLDRNADYLKNKLKKPSLTNIWTARSVYQGIDDDYNLIRTLNIEEFLIKDSAN